MSGQNQTKPRAYDEGPVTVKLLGEQSPSGSQWQLTHQWFKFKNVLEGPYVCTYLFKVTIVWLLTIQIPS